MASGKTLKRSNEESIDLYRDRDGKVQWYRTLRTAAKRKKTVYAEKDSAQGLKRSEHTPRMGGKKSYECLIFST